MTEQERYLITFLNETFAKRLIQRYPQILAEKVWEGNLCSLIADTDEGEKQLAYYGGYDPLDTMNQILIQRLFNETVEKVEVFIRETHD